jgi:hypothetical protein
MVVTPPLHQGSCVRVLKAMSRQPAKFSKGDEVVLSLLSEIVAAAMFYAANVAMTAAAGQSALGRACVANVAVPQAGAFPIDLGDDRHRVASGRRRPASSPMWPTRSPTRGRRAGPGRI